MGMTIREEQYLAKIAGEDVAVPTPLTREEALLDKIAKNGGGGGLPPVTTADVGKVMVVGRAPSAFIPEQQITPNQPSSLANVTAPASGFVAGDVASVTINGETYDLEWTTIPEMGSFFFRDEDPNIVIGNNIAQLGEGWVAMVGYDGEVPEECVISAVVSTSEAEPAWTAQRGMSFVSYTAEETVQGNDYIFRIADGTQLVKDAKSGKIISVLIPTPLAAGTTFVYTLAAYYSDGVYLIGPDLLDAAASKTKTYEFYKSLGDSLECVVHGQQ